MENCRKYVCWFFQQQPSHGSAFLVICRWECSRESKDFFHCVVVVSLYFIVVQKNVLVVHVFSHPDFVPPRQRKFLGRIGISAGYILAKDKNQISWFSGNMLAQTYPLWIHTVVVLIKRSCAVLQRWSQLEKPVKNKDFSRERSFSRQLLSCFWWSFTVFSCVFLCNPTESTWRQFMCVCACVCIALF